MSWNAVCMYPLYCMLPFYQNNVNAYLQRHVIPFTGATPLYIANQNGHSDVVDIPIRNGARVNMAKKVRKILVSLPLSSGVNLPCCTTRRKDLIHTMLAFSVSRSDPTDCCWMCPTFYCAGTDIKEVQHSTHLCTIIHCGHCLSWSWEM